MSERIMQAGDSFEVELPMRWGDADMNQHLNNALYFQFMEQARVLLIDESGSRQEGLGFVVAHCSCDFKQAITYPAMIRVRLIIDRVGRTSFDHRVEMSVVGDLPGHVRAQGRVVMVLVDKATGKPHPWPESMLVKLGQITTPAVQQSLA
jgi:acyl-CoA thioester hydrolase